MRAALGPVIASVRATSLEPDILMDDDGLDLAPFGITGRVVHTPGHTKGSMSLVLSSGEAFVGDLAMNRLPACWRPSFGIFAEEPDRHRASWQRLVGLGARTAYPAHGRPFAVSRLGS